MTSSNFFYWKKCKMHLTQIVSERHVSRLNSWLDMCDSATSLPSTSRKHFVLKEISKKKQILALRTRWKFRSLFPLFWGVYKWLLYKIISRSI